MCAVTCVPRNCVGAGGQPTQLSGFTETSRNPTCDEELNLGETRNPVMPGPLLGSLVMVIVVSGVQVSSRQCTIVYTIVYTLCAVYTAGVSRSDQDLSQPA